MNHNIMPLDWRVVILNNFKRHKIPAIEKWLTEVVGEKDVKWRIAGGYGVYAFADFEDAVIFNMTWNGI